MTRPYFTAKVFLEDTVELKTKPGLQGIVVKTWHDFEDHESDSDDDDLAGTPALHHVVVHWSDGSAPVTVHEDELIVTDRSFSHGDVVKRSPNDIQSGTVIDVKMALDLEMICPPMTRYEAVDACAVDFAKDFAVDRRILYDNWLGVIEEVEEEVTIILSDGNICVVKDPNELDVCDNVHDRSMFFPDVLVPGLAVRAPSRVFKNAQYLMGKYQPSHRQGFLLRCEAVSITVNWISYNPLSLDQTPAVTPPPNTIDDFANIIVFKDAEQHCTYELMDRVKIVDPAVLEERGLNGTCPYVRSRVTRQMCPREGHDHAFKFTTEEMKVVKTVTHVTVQWQDLGVSENIPATSLVPYLNVDDQDVWPADYVLLKAGEVLQDQPGGQVALDRAKADKLGIVQSVNANARTAIVKWFSEEREAGLDDQAEELSLYEIVSHPDLKFCKGDKVIVSREREASLVSASAPVAPSVDDILTVVNRGNEIFHELVREQKALLKMEGITTMDDAQIASQWIERRAPVLLKRYGIEGVEALDRYISESNKMAPRTLSPLVYRDGPGLPRENTEESLDDATGQSNGAGITAEQQAQTLKDLEAMRIQVNWFGQIWKVHTDRPTALVRFMDGTEEEISVGRLMVVDDEDEVGDDEKDSDEGEGFEEYNFDDAANGSSDDSWDTESEDENDATVELGSNDLAKAKADVEGEGDTDKKADTKGTAETNGTSTVASVPTASTIPAFGTAPPLAKRPTWDTLMTHTIAVRNYAEHKNWKSFLVVENVPEDHHFLSAASSTRDKPRQWIRRVRAEHSIMSTSLPDGIRVRAFESRLDLLRVLIAGPQQTPYEDALLMFDFYLPDQFPQQPPRAYFHSWTGGIGRINPNLYEDGNVCLSLLNTWHGKDETETWTPNSSILQLLISLQGLVLVPHPYYNETGFEKFIGTLEASRNSALYNEKVYLLTLKSIYTILNNPPVPFIKEVQHFYFERQNLEHAVIQGFELIARSEELQAEEDRKKEEALRAEQGQAKDSAQDASSDDESITVEVVEETLGVAPGTPQQQQSSRPAGDASRRESVDSKAKTQVEKGEEEPEQQAAETPQVDSLQNGNDKDVASETAADSELSASLLAMEPYEMKHISRGALRVLKKHIDALSSFLED
ncbi:hypothetical protein BGZ73_007432 [Actinomortierella ambigua]|nr:hypothetical protein BGZ73_007432 [Actinomortierella ambigua]